MRASGGRTALRARCGYTMVELMVAMFLSLIVVLAIGRILLMNQRTWLWSRDKTELQQNVTEGLEWMARSIRAANTLQVASGTEFSTYDENGTLVHTYLRAAVGSEYRLQEDGTPLLARDCTQFSVAPNADTTCLTLNLELADKAGNKVAAMTRATLRNRAFEY